MTTPEPFDPDRACTEPAGCPLTAPCTLRCHERFLNDEPQDNDWRADQQDAEAWQRYYDANPGAEAASRAACAPQMYEETA